MSVYVRDVTERKEREQRLEQFERIVETVNDGVYATDGEGRFIFVNDAFVAMSEHTREELLGSHGSAFFGERFVDTDEREWRELISGERDSVEFETDITGPNGETRTVHNQFVALELEDEMGRVGVTRDATERKERERALEEYERIVETVADGIYVLDETREFQRVNDAFTSMTRFDRSELLGAHASLVFGENFGDFDAEASRQFEAGGTDVAVFEEEIYTAEGDAITVESRFTQFDVEDGQGRVGVVRDVTERKRYEERLQALYDSSHELLGADTPAAISEILVETAGGVLDLPGIVVYRYDDDRDLLVPEAESVESDFMREEFPAVPPDDSSLTGHVYASGGPRYYENVIESPYLQISPDETQMRAGLFVPLGEEGVLVAGSRDIDGFDASTRQLVEVLATNATTAYDRVAREQQLVRQRAQLEALNSLNDVAREITGAVIDQSTREEIEQTVCERLADSESYLFAWIGEADPSTETVNLRAEAGVEGYLDGISISVDPDDERSEGPTGRAFRTGEIQVTHDIHADSRHDPWREYIEQYGFRSSAAVPIVHEGTVYGVLNVYAERPYAFEGDERDVISQVGEIVGHAIAAAERKRALMSDELVELEFQIRDVFAALDLPVETSGTITLDHTVPVGDDEFLVYGTATPDAIETVTKLVETVPHWESITVNSEGDPVHFEVRLTSPPVLSVVASLGGYVERAVIEDGDYQMRIHLAPSVDVRRVIDAVEETYPGAELLRRRQITRTQDDQQSLQWRLITDLTDRQRAALEAAYHAGFFEWPRDTSGEEVADSLGVAPPTFHQHLRKAERKVFDAVFSSSVQSVA
jgi:PAS domain S-box-containing protein